MIHLPLSLKLNKTPGVTLAEFKFSAFVTV